MRAAAWNTKDPAKVSLAYTPGKYPLRRARSFRSRHSAGNGNLTDIASPPVSTLLATVISPSTCTISTGFDRLLVAQSRRVLHRPREDCRVPDAQVGKGAGLQAGKAAVVLPGGS